MRWAALLLLLSLGSAITRGEARLGSQAQVVALVFISSECPISYNMAPDIQRIYRKFSTNAVQFLLVYPNPSDSEERIAKHRREYRMGAPFVRDFDHSLVKKTGVTITPEAAVLDRQGTVVYRGRINDRFLSIGRARPEVTTHDLEEAIRAALAGQSPKNFSTRAIGCYIEEK